MGGSGSKTPPANPPPLFNEPWRKINWTDKEGALQYVKNYKPQVEGQQLRILLHGPVGSGKSSFINSVNSIFHDRMYKLALADNTFHGSFTVKYRTYRIKTSPESRFPFVFNDIMGLSNEGVQEDDIKLALKGHIREGYTFNSDARISEDDPFYSSYPDPSDKVHVLVCVVPADNLSVIDKTIMTKIRNIRIEASRLEIPQVVALTKIDKACPEIKKDLRNVYKSRYLKEKMEEFSVNTGVPVNCIFPVKNYSEEIDLNSDVDCLILSTLKDIIHCGDDYIKLQNEA